MTTWRRRAPSRPVTLRGALARHALVTLVVASVATASAAAIARHAARQQAGHTATHVSAAIADTVLTDLAEHDYASPHGYDRATVLGHLQPYLQSGTLHRFKLWIVEDDQARIVVSDEPRIEGTTRALPDPLLPSGAGQPRGLEVPDDAEHRYEAADRDRLHEVFLGFQDTASNAMLLETYIRLPDSAAHAQAGIAAGKHVLVAILATALAATPLTIAATRRAQRSAARHAALAELAMSAADRERHELAQQLHDGPIQTLAAANVAITAQRPAQPGVREIVRDGIRQLRTITAAMLPDTLPPADLAGRLPALLRAYVPEPIRLDVHVLTEERAPLTDEQTRTILRCARELVRNAVRHGHPTQVTVTLDLADPLELRVKDNGRGFDSDNPIGSDHFGLALIEQAVAALGGELAVRSRPNAGCSATVRIPR